MTMVENLDIAVKQISSDLTKLKETVPEQSEIINRLIENFGSVKNELWAQNLISRIDKNLNKNLRL